MKDEDFQYYWFKYTILKEHEATNTYLINIFFKTFIFTSDINSQDVANIRNELLVRKRKFNDGST